MSDDVRAGLRVSTTSLVWTAVTSTTAVVVGVASHTLVLVAFGATGVLDGAGSLALVLHFRHALRHEAISEARERLAHRIVGIGLIVTGVATAAESIRRLAVHAESHRSTFGAGLAAASIVVLALLARRKIAVAARIPSPALRADGLLSATGALLAVVAVLGAAVTIAWWVDAAAALVIGAAAAGTGVTSLRQ
ncbi:MAG TPA: cation transporter [Acidimicrobiales bacterium]|nr:cation transporter [Acidimicrobiales bacterium]